MGFNIAEGLSSPHRTRLPANPLHVGRKNVIFPALKEFRRIQRSACVPRRRTSPQSQGTLATTTGGKPVTKRGPELYVEHFMQRAGFSGEDLGSNWCRYFGNSADSSATRIHGPHCLPCSMPSVDTADSSPGFIRHLCSARMNQIPASGTQSGSWVS
jgi:hypothetical protein